MIIIQDKSKSQVNDDRRFFMKKTILFLIVAALLPFSALFGACSGGGTFTARNYDSGDAEITALCVDAEDRTVEGGISDDGRIHIDCAESEKEFYDISLSGSELTVKLVFDKDWTDFIGTKPAKEYRTIKIRVPLDGLTRLDVKTTNEAITVSSLAVSGEISLSSNGGDIVFEELFVGKGMEATVKNGDITGSLVGGWDDFSIECSIKKGESNLPEKKEGGEKYLNLSGNNGDIHVEFIK